MDKESLKGNLKLALFGTGCTKEYAEKGSEAILDMIYETFVEKRMVKEEQAKRERIYQINLQCAREAKEKEVLQRVKEAIINCLPVHSYILCSGGCPLCRFKKELGIE